MSGPERVDLKKLAERFSIEELVIAAGSLVLLVALLQNSQTRNDQATQHKLNAIADGLADLMERFAEDDPGLTDEIDELKAAVGLEDRESTTGNDNGSQASANGQRAKAGARS